MIDRLHHDLGKARDTDSNWFTDHLRNVGIPEKVAREWGDFYGNSIALEGRPTLDQTIAMHAAGIGPEEATDWYFWLIPFEDAIYYRTHGLERFDAIGIWRATGVEPEPLGKWRKSKLPVERVIRLIAAGVTYAERDRWDAVSDETLVCMAALRNTL